MIACKQVSETAHALHLSIFEQPAFIDFFNNLLRNSFILAYLYSLSGKAGSTFDKKARHVLS